jgi:hypothetical protein
LTRFFFPRRDESFPACYLSSANRGATANRPRDPPNRPIVGHDYDYMSCDHQLYVCALSCNAVTRFHMVTSVPALALYVQSTPTRLFHLQKCATVVHSWNTLREEDPGNYGSKSVILLHKGKSRTFTIDPSVVLVSNGTFRRDRIPSLDNSSTT